MNFSGSWIGAWRCASAAGCVTHSSRPARTALVHRVERVLGRRARPEELARAGREQRVGQLARADDAAAGEVAVVGLAQAADAVADEGAEARGRAAHGVANELHRTLLVSGGEIGPTDHGRPDYMSDYTPTGPSR